MRGGLTAFLVLGAASSLLAADPLRVATVSTVLTEIATEIGGPAVRVTALLKPGVDPHAFEPAPSDVRALVGADLILESGLGLDTTLDKLVAESGSKARVFSAGEALRDRLVTVEERGRLEPDPHWWNSPGAVAQVARAVAGEIEALRPAAAGAVAARAQAYVRRIEALDAWARTRFAALPPNRRNLVTTHDAFAWFARDYGLTVRPISGLSPDAEPDPRALAALVALIRRDAIPVVFVEAPENSKLASALARESGARLGGALYPDGLVPQPDGSTYEALFRHNVDVILDGLAPR